MLLIIVILIVVLFALAAFGVIVTVRSRKSTKDFYKETGKIVEVRNVMDDSPMLWEESEFVTLNFPGLDYEIPEKKAILELALKNPKGYGVLDVGAHIGDVAIQLALALKNAGRDDVIVYAVDPSSLKCEFMEKMVSVNRIQNIKVINCGLSDSVKTLGHSRESVQEVAPEKKNTGAQVWDEKLPEKLGTSTNEEEISNFYPLDYLWYSGVVGPLGLLHIDVEGHEVSMLRGAEQVIGTYHPVLTIESWESVCKEEKDCPKLFGALKELSYTTKGFMPNNDVICVHRSNT